MAISKHEWRENTDEGDIRLVTAQREGGKRKGGTWTFRARLKSEDEWTVLEKIPLDDLEYLRDVLFNKYQRKRVPHEQVLELDALIEKAKAKAAARAKRT